jgi:hypothetical protein
MTRISRLFLSAVFTAHLVLAAAWVWLMPGGFPLAHPRFWANRVLPLAVLALVGVYLWARFRRRDDVLRTLALAVAAFWLAAAVSGRIVFPVTARLLWLAPLAGAAVVALVATRYIQSERLRRVPVAALVMVCAAVGALVPLSQRGEDASTRPLNVALKLVPATRPAQSLNVIRVDDSLRVQPNGGVVSARVGRLHLDVEPLLTFISRSPDRCWTLLAPRRDRRNPPRDVTGVRAAGAGVEIDYVDDGFSRLAVRRGDEQPGAIVIDAASKLPSAVYSHLNSYCAILISGHRRLEVSFSPCPDVRVEVTNSDYPFGQPVRFAYVDAGETFHVVEASSAEKGPFRALATGKLKRGEPLTITLYDEGEPAARVTLDDWSAQAGTALSPTAGWGVPVNSITFTLTGASSSSPAFISVELAGTGIGRGYDSVGHAAGTYRNRVRVEQVERDERDGQND